MRNARKEAARSVARAMRIDADARAEATALTVWHSGGNWLWLPEDALSSRQ